jgi:hypothetical protein
MPEVILNIGMLREEVEDTGEGTGSCVHCGEG